MSAVREQFELRHTRLCRRQRARPWVPTLATLWIIFFVGSLCLATTSAQAQERRPGVPEFTRQGLLIVNFSTENRADLKLGKRAADAVRSRVDKLVDHREVSVVDGGNISDRLFNAGFDPDSTVDLPEIHGLSEYFRVDEFVRAEVRTTAQRVRIAGWLVLVRDERLRQPVAVVEASRLDSAATLFARNIVAARAQLAPLRRCENALRDGQFERALSAARQGVALYPKSTIARTCQVWAMRELRVPARDVLAVAQEVLAQDAGSYYALDAAAVALDTLHRKEEAATAYLALAATDSGNVDLAMRVIYSLIDGGNSKRAEPFVVHMAEMHPDEVRFLQQTWHAAYENRSWKRAVAAGEALFTRDSVARSDSTFFLRLGTAYRELRLPYDAIRVLASGVKSFPGDQRLYSLYAQAIKAEADTVLPRGLAQFPASADLLALNGKDLRARGKIAESLDATRRAMDIDSTMAQGRLVVAQLEIELGRADSALTTLRRALAAGEDSSLVAQFTLGKGNTFYRAASASRLLSDFDLAYRFLSLADTIQTSVQSKFLVGASAFGVAQAALQAIPNTSEKTERCRLATLGGSMMAAARTGLTAGTEAFGETATQSLYYLLQLEPYATSQLKACEQPH